MPSTRGRRVGVRHGSETLHRRWVQRRPAPESVVDPVQVAAVSTPEDGSRWRWRIVNYAGEVIEESSGTFPTIGTAVEHGSKRLSQIDVVDNSVPYQPHGRPKRFRRTPE